MVVFTPDRIFQGGPERASAPLGEEKPPGTLGRFHARKRPCLPQDEPAVIMA